MTHFVRNTLAVARGLWIMALVLAVSLRAVATPVMLGADADGVMTICAGGEVYYVTLDGDPADAPGTHSEPCPYTGMAVADLQLDLPFAAPGRFSRTTTLPLPDVLIIKASRARQNTPRAPPVLSLIT